MTRKDYELIALALKHAQEDHINAGRYAQADGAADAAVVLSRRLEGASRTFDRKRFLIACGLEHAAARA